MFSDKSKVLEINEKIKIVKIGLKIIENYGTFLEF